MSANTKPDSVCSKWFTILVVPNRVSTGPGMADPEKVAEQKQLKREDKSRVEEEPVAAGTQSLRMINPVKY